MKYAQALYTTPMRCEDCGCVLTVWVCRPYPGHNLSTLYECTYCRAVFTLADFVGYYFGLLP